MKEGGTNLSTVPGQALDTESVGTFSQTTTMTMLSINRPVSVSAPLKSQVTQIPASLLKDLSQ